MKRIVIGYLIWMAAAVSTGVWACFHFLPPADAGQVALIITGFSAFAVVLTLWMNWYISATRSLERAKR